MSQQRPARPPANMSCSLSPRRHGRRYFSQHICYCLILEKKVAEQRVMKSKPNTRPAAPGKKHTVSILISLTESRNLASVTHHLPSLLSFGKWKKIDERGGVLVGLKTGKWFDIQDAAWMLQKEAALSWRSISDTSDQCLSTSRRQQHERSFSTKYQWSTN